MTANSEVRNSAGLRVRPPVIRNVWAHSWGNGRVVESHAIERLDFVWGDFKMEANRQSSSVSSVCLKMKT